MNLVAQQVRADTKTAIYRQIHCHYSAVVYWQVLNALANPINELVKLSVKQEINHNINQ